MSLELLTIQAEGALDPRGHVAGSHGVTMAVAEDGQALWVGAEVPHALADELAATFERSPVSARPDDRPPALQPCIRLLETRGHPVTVRAGPSFLIEACAGPAVTGRIVCSNASIDDALRGATPGNWHLIEWNELLDGRLGPFALAVEDERVVSVAHTPLPVTARAAECGVWTHPESRGRGYAAALTAAWAALLRPSGRHLFYSTDAHNHSSRRVAQRLDLRPLGWTWRLEHARDRELDRSIHPLSILRAGSPPSSERA
jgi:GNAT superfamily N-acetyltransferase